jgi:hypothetical protein
MGEIKKVYKIKLVCGIIYNFLWCKKKFVVEDNKNIVDKINNSVLPIFKKEFSVEEIDLQSEIIKFDFSNYYNEEMGEELYRYWISFSPSVQLSEVYKLKILSNEIEKKYFSDDNGNRKVNLDTGYVDGSKLVLFSTKNYSHRVYIGEGIFAEVTLLYKHKQFHILEWTYPDYKTSTAIEFFSKVREVYNKEYTK